MTLEDAAALADEAAGQQRVDAARSIETREGWYFPYRVDGEVLVGSSGVIVNKQSGACRVLGSAFSVERDIAAYDEGFQFDSYDLTIVSIADLARTLDALEKIGPSIVEPEVAHGTVWKIARPLTRKELRSRLATLPCTFVDVRLYFRIEVLQEVRRSRTFVFEAREHGDGAQPG